MEYVYDSSFTVDGWFDPAATVEGWFDEDITASAGAPPVNLLSFADQAMADANNWAAESGVSSVAADRSVVLDGGTSLKVTASGTADYYVRTPNGTSGVPVSANTTYTAMVWLRYGDLPASTAALIQLAWFDSSGTSISNANNGWPSGYTTTQFDPVYVTGTSPSNAAYAAIFIAGDSDVSGAVYYLDRAGLFEGTVATGDHTYTGSELVATATATASATAEASGVKSLAATATATASGSAAVSRVASLAASATVTASTSAAVSRIATLAATATATASASAAVSGVKSLAASDTATASASTAASRVASIAASAIATAAATAATLRVASIGASSTAAASGSVDVASGPVSIDAVATAVAVAVTQPLLVIYTFSPPTRDVKIGRPSGMWYVSRKRGRTLLRESGVWSEVGSVQDSRVQAAERAYRGGYTYRLTSPQRDELVAAGYGSGITETLE